MNVGEISYPKKVIPLSELIGSRVSALVLKLEESEVNGSAVTLLKDQLREGDQGKCDVAIELCRKDYEALIRLGENWRITPSLDLVKSMQGSFGKAAIRLIYT